MANKFEKLFEQGLIGKMRLKNRIVMPPMGTCLASVDQSLNDYYNNYQFERAEGGAGLQILGVVSVDKLGAPLPCVPGIYRDNFIPGLSRLAEGIHERGAKCAVQLHHAGRAAYCSVIGGQSVAPSAIPCLAVGEVPKELSEDEIKGLVEAFGDGAFRAQRAGFDAVEVHGAHGYLVAQFLSPYSNKRTDSYGGDFEGRLRFAREIVENIRAKTGPDFPIIFRFSGDEYLEGGITIEDTKKIAPRLVEAGADAIHVSVGSFYDAGGSEKIISPMHIPHGPIIGLAEQIKEVLDVPVIAVSSITPELGEQTLQEGKADFISFGRALIADPYLPNKLAQGREEEICNCIRCNNCILSIFKLQHLACTVNPRVGREEESRITPAPEAKKVMVIGGGPAGMEAAITAGMRGHEVTLYERNDRLGGEQLILSTKLPGKEEIETLVTYRDIMLDRLDNVKVMLNTEVDRALVEQERPDVAIVATGGKPVIPNIPGIDSSKVMTAHDVIAGKAEVQGDKVTVLGGGLVGTETANFIASKGKEVTLVEMLDEVATDMDAVTRIYLLGEMNKRGIEILTKTSATEVVEEGVIVSDRDGNKKTIEADTIILSLGVTPVNELLKELKGVVPKLFACGDAKGCGKIIDAIRDGFHRTKKI